MKRLVGYFFLALGLFTILSLLDIFVFERALDSSAVLKNVFLTVVLSWLFFRLRVKQSS